MFWPRFNLRNETVMTLRVSLWMTMWLGFTITGVDAGLGEGAGLGDVELHHKRGEYGRPMGIQVEVSSGQVDTQV